MRPEPSTPPARTSPLEAALAEAVGDAIVRLAADGVVTSWNAAAETLYGRPAADAIGLHVESLVPAPRRAELAELLARVHRGAHVRGLETEALREDGTVVPVRVAHLPLCRPSGEVDGVLVLARDISDGYEAERVLRRRERELRAIFEAALDAILILDDERRLLGANPAALRLLGLDAGEIVGARFDDYAPDARDSWAELLRTGTFKGTFAIARADDAVRTAELAATADVLPGRHLAVLRDVTEERLLARQLQDSQRMEAVGRLAGGVAHDFNNLLTAINGFGELALSRLDGDDERDAKLRRDVGQILAAGARARDLTQQLLAYSRRQILKTETLDLNEVVRETQKLLRRVIGEDIEVESTLAPDLLPIRGDAGQLSQVLMNLAINARDAMRFGGRLTLETRNVELDEHAARTLFDARPGVYALLTVADTGHGMDAETQKRAFDPFYTTKDVGEGTGLGLSTVYGIVKQLDGYVTVASAPGDGAVFSVYFPPDVAPQADAVPQARQEVQRGRERILLVEDEPLVRDLVRDMLAQQGYTVDAYGDPLEALEADVEACDLLITDIVMPTLNGRELADALSARRPDLKVMYTSGYTSSAIVERGILDDDIAFLQKPFSGADLSAAVRGVLDA